MLLELPFRGAIRRPSAARTRALLFAFLAASNHLAVARDVPTPDGAPVTLQEAVEMALQSSPDLASASSAVRAREGAVLQAGRRPNPELQLISENIGGDDDLTGGVQSSLSLGQRFELGGKRAARVTAAEASRGLASMDFEARRAAVIATVTRRFVDLLVAQRRMELAEQAVSIAEETAGAVTERVSAGKVSPIEETRASLVLGTELIERDRARLDLDVARLRLAAAWGADAAEFSHAEGDLEQVPAIPDLGTLLLRAGLAPEVARWDAEIAWREAIVELERARAAPDVTIGGGYRQFDVGTGAAIVSVTVPLPFANRNRGARIEAQEELLGAQAQQRSARLRSRQAVSEAHATLRRAEQEAATVRSEMLPGAEDAFAAVSEGYRLGKFGLTEVLDARRTLTAVRLQLLRATAEAHAAAAELQRLTSVASAETTNGSDEHAN